MTLLPQGDILFTGGFGGRVWIGGFRLSGGNPSVSAERYNPTTGRWTGAGHMATTRLRHTATLLHDGRVLVVGGVTTLSDRTSRALATAEIYDPGSNTWTAAASLHSPRSDHSATLLADGRVLVVGGHTPTSYSDPSTEPPLPKRANVPAFPVTSSNAALLKTTSQPKQFKP